MGAPFFFFFLFGLQTAKSKKAERSLQRLVKKVRLLEAGFRILPPSRHKLCLLVDVQFGG
jgi:hypothetical protein